jgi:polyphosphate kinase
VLPRFVVMPDGERFVAARAGHRRPSGHLVPRHDIGEHYAFRVTRNADLALEEDEADDLLVAIEMELRRRRFGRAVRLEVAADMSRGPGGPAGHRARCGVRRRLPRRPRPSISAVCGGSTPSTARPARRDLDADDAARPGHGGHEPTDLFAVLRERDVLVHHPYDSFATSVEAFIAQAAEDPAVLGIKQTLYRTSGDSPIVASLIRAAENGKQVAAIVELKARFDEEANIGWARALEEAGVHVVYGIVGLKTHSKTALVLRREEDGVRHYCHVGTGTTTPRRPASTRTSGS